MLINMSQRFFKNLIIKKALLAIFIYQPATGCFSQNLNTTTYVDTSLPYTELNPAFYDFSYPINSDLLHLDSFHPPDDGVYLKADHGHRYLQNTQSKTDNHGGFDYWSNHTYQGVVYDDSNKTPIICMCDGMISQVVNGPEEELELTAGGRSVQVVCNQQSQAFGSSIKINYRHLSSLGALPTLAEDLAPGTIAINKGDVIGFMGESGATTNIHLHLSAQVDHPLNGNSFVSTSRLFNPNAAPQVLKTLENVTIKYLHSWQDKALFRISWPFNETINRFEFTNGSYIVVFNKEEAYDTGAAIRDNHNCIPNVQVFAYPFNGKQTAANLFENQKATMPAIYPASPQRDEDLATYLYPHFPIAENSVSNVYDFVIENIPQSAATEDFVIRLSDVWGHTVEGSFEEALGSDDHQSAAVEIYPNPTTNLITIKTGSFDRLVKISLFNINGKHLKTITTFESAEILNLTDFPSGLYLLQVEKSGATKSFKVIKG